MKTYNNCKPPPPHPPPHKKITRLFLILNASCARYYLCFKFLEMNLHIEREIGYFFVSSFNSINKVGLYSAIIFLHCSFSISKLWLHVPLFQMMCNNSDCDNLTQCMSLACFGKFLHTVIAGWDDSECQRTYDAIAHHTCLLKNVKLVINSKPGTITL